MIYTKNWLKDGSVVRNRVTPKNTYTRCVKCGKEIQMDLRDLILAKVEDPYDTEVNCPGCTDKLMHTSNIDFDAVVRLVNALDDMGYGIVLEELFSGFDIADIQELTAQECELFVDDLLSKIMEVRHDR